MSCLRGLRINYSRKRDVYVLSFYIFVAAGVEKRSEKVFIFFKNLRCLGKNILRQDSSNNGMRMFGQIWETDGEDGIKLYNYLSYVISAKKVSALMCKVQGDPFLFDARRCWITFLLIMIITFCKRQNKAWSWTFFLAKHE